MLLFKNVLFHFLFLKFIITKAFVATVFIDYTLWVKKKQDTKLLPMTSPNVNRFPNFFNLRTQ